MSGRHRQEDKSEPESQTMSDYDGRYGEAEPAGDPDNDDAYAPGTAKDIAVTAAHAKAQGTSGWV
jgi:hypothetical protein